MHENTPLRKLEYNGKQFYLKMDCYQPTYSFKIRGIGHLCQHLYKKGYRKLVSSSGGNAGYSAAYAAQQLGMDILVVVPKTTSIYMQQQMQHLGATVKVVGASWNEAHAFASAYSEANGAAYIHPFEHPLLWEGHSSIIDECAEKMEEPDAIIVSVGGGGLLCGVLQGIQKNGWNRTHIIGAETEGAASFAAALAARKPVVIEAITTIAVTLGAKMVSPAIFEYGNRHRMSSYVTNDKKAVEACQWLANDFHVLVEPACGAALAAILDENTALVQDFERILVIVCGGAAATPTALQEWVAQVQ